MGWEVARGLVWVDLAGVLTGVMGDLGSVVWRRLAGS
jgi:hypothetical protein